MNYLIKKRDGSLAAFDISKIEDAITKAAEATKSVMPVEVVRNVAIKAVSELHTETGTILKRNAGI